MLLEKKATLDDELSEIQKELFSIQKELFDIEKKYLMPVNSENPDEIKKKFIFFKEMSNNYFKEPLSDISENDKTFESVSFPKKETDDGNQESNENDPFGINESEDDAKRRLNIMK